MALWYLKFSLKNGSQVYCRLESKHPRSDEVIKEDLCIGRGFTTFQSESPNCVVSVNMNEISAVWVSTSPFNQKAET